MSEAPRAGSIAASLAADGAEPDAKFAFLKPPAEGGGTDAGTGKRHKGKGGPKRGQSPKAGRRCRRD